MTATTVRLTLAAICLTLAIASCSSQPPGLNPTPVSSGVAPLPAASSDAGVTAGHGHDHASPTSMSDAFAQADPALVRQLAQATARFHSTTQATRAGYSATPCVAVPALGGMGEHWVNESLVDPVFNVHQPEALLYEPGPDGRHTLVGVEYIVIDVGQERPSFGDRLFDIGGAPIPAPHWTLHVWLWRDNPSGLFAPFNPDVACP